MIKLFSSDRSIYHHLQLSLSLLFVVSLALGGTLTFFSSSHQIDRDYDSQLIADSYLIWTLVQEELEEEDDINEVKDILKMQALHNSQRHQLDIFNASRGFRVWHNHSLIVRSNTAPAHNIPESPKGFSNQQTDHNTWRVYTMVLQKKHITLEVWENRNIRKRLLLDILQGVGIPIFFMIPFVWGALLLSIRYGLKGLRQLTHQLKERGPDSLEPIAMDGTSRELKPLKYALNALIDKLKTTLDRERLQMDTIAHEMRTPLSTLKLQGQLIKEAKDEPDRITAINSLLASLDHTVTLADTLLVYSKVKQQEIHFETVNLFNLSQQVMAEYGVMANTKHIELELLGDEHITLSSSADMLGILIGILIDNAIKYTPAGGRVKATICNHELIIEDTGIGINDIEKPKVLEKFYRGKHNQKGSGLGLAIAHEITQRLNIKMSLYDTSHHSGLRVVLAFAA